MKNNVSTIYLAGGCFWGLEKLFSSIPGVISAISGYANGKEGLVPTYEILASTQHKEAVKITYNTEDIHLESLLFAFFEVIDPTLENQQGFDIGVQYQTGIYWEDEDSKAIIFSHVQKEKQKVSPFCVELKPLRNFFPAENYHQKYLDKHPSGYCHIHHKTMEKIIAHILIMEGGHTEAPFSSPIYKENSLGIFVDAITRVPLFSSLDKYDSGSGWPSFTRPLSGVKLVERDDYSLGSHRIEVLTPFSYYHLGHVFYNDPSSPSGIRYCINGLALAFIPYNNLEKLGYGELKKILK